MGIIEPIRELSDIEMTARITSIPRFKSTLRPRIMEDSNDQQMVCREFVRRRALINYMSKRFNVICR